MDFSLAVWLPTLYNRASSSARVTAKAEHTHDSGQGVREDHMSEEKSKRNPVDAMFPDVDAGEKPSRQCPRKKSWHRVTILVGIFATIAVVAIMFGLSQREMSCGLYGLVLGLGVGEALGRSRVRRADERDPIRAICLIIEGMNENELRVFTREEQRSLARLQQMLMMSVNQGGH